MLLWSPILKWFMNVWKQLTNLKSWVFQSKVIDLRTLRPLDTSTVFDSVRKTNRVVIVEEAWKTGGFSGELVSAVQEECFDYLDGPVGRVSGLDVPAPYNGTLEASTIPNSDTIIESVRRLYGI